MTNTRGPAPVAGLLEHGQGLAQIAACNAVRSLGLGGQPELEVCVRLPAWVAKCLRKGQCPLEMVGGPLVLAQFAVHDADHEIGVGDIAAATDRAKYVPAARQEGKGRRLLSLLAANLGEKEPGFGFAVGVGESPAELKDLFEAGGSIAQPTLATVGARKSGQAVGLPRDVPQLGEDGIAVREVRNCLWQAILAAAQVTQAAQQGCLGVPVTRQPGSAKSSLVGTLPLVPASVYLEEVGK